jgi:predicted dehydrogenase
MFRLGIIGAGIMGERLATAAQATPDVVTLAGVWDPQPVAVARIVAVAPELAGCASAAEVIAGCDCLYVASPPASHLLHGAAALAAGRSLFCEKPLSVDLAAARAFIAGHGGARAAVNFPFASSLAVARLVEWLPSIGEPHSLTIDVAFRVWPRPWQHDAASWLDRRAEGGFTREVVSHFLFLSRRLLGPLTLNEALVQFGDDGRSEFDIRAQLTAGTIPVNLTGNVGTTPKDDHNVWTLRGDHGAIRLRDWSIAERQSDSGVWVADADALPNERARPAALRRQLEGVARMTAGETHHLATLAEALEVQEVVEAILVS